MPNADVLFAGTDGGAVTDLVTYVAGGGFQALAKARALTPDEVIEEVSTSDLRGRGGAAFPTGRKWSFVPKPEQLPKPHYLVVNADESEPGSFKDREILERIPFRFVEGCLIAAYANQAAHVFVYIRGEYDRPYAKTFRMWRELRDFTNVILPGKSHLTAIAAPYIPKEYAESLVRFVDGNDG